MKKSVYMAQRREYHIRRPDTGWVGKRGELAYSEAVEEDVCAAEAAGKVWDPEDPPLESLLTFDELHHVIRPAAPAKGWFIARIVAVENPNHPGSKWQETYMREAVRRWNAWPELWALAGNWEDPQTYRSAKSFRERLTAILDGTGTSGTNS